MLKSLLFNLFIEQNSILIEGATTEGSCMMQRATIISTLERFIQPKCIHRLQLINEFSHEDQKWENQNFGLIDIKQFNGCHVKIESPTFQVSSNKYLSSLIDALTNKINFTYTKVKMTQQEFIKRIKEKNRNFHVSIDLSSLDFQVSLLVFPFYHEAFGIMVATGESYSSFEKMILPFDAETWLLIGVFFISGFITILIVKTRHIGWQNFVFGSKVQTPIFNMFVAIFGQGQNILPGRCFARYLLMMFIILCLVIRTVYQGIQFELIFKVMRNFIVRITSCNLNLE